MNIPNFVTAFRGFLTPFLFYSIVYEYFGYALIIIFIACVTDLLDGYLARRLNQSSRNGAFFDCFMDFLLIISGNLGLWFIGVYPLWITMLNTIMFVLFIRSFRSGVIIYDPVGRVFGALTILTLLVSILFPFQIVISTICQLLIITAVVSMFLKIIMR